jgi:hypothetical protein
MKYFKIETSNNFYYFIYNNDITNYKKEIEKKYGECKVKECYERSNMESFVGYEILGYAVLEKHSREVKQDQLTFDLTIT